MIVRYEWNNLKVFQFISPLRLMFNVYASQALSVKIILSLHQNRYSRFSINLNRLREKKKTCSHIGINFINSYRLFLLELVLGWASDSLFANNRQSDNEFMETWTDAILHDVNSTLMKV